MKKFMRSATLRFTKKLAIKNKLQTALCKFQWSRCCAIGRTLSLNKIFIFLPFLRGSPHRVTRHTYRDTYVEKRRLSLAQSTWFREYAGSWVPGDNQHTISVNDYVIPRGNRLNRGLNNTTWKVSCTLGSTSYRIKVEKHNKKRGQTR